MGSNLDPIRSSFYSSKRYPPAVYYPSYRLNYFCIEKQNNHLVITYVTVPKTPERELTRLQRLMTLGKAPKPPESIAAKTVIDL